MCDTDDDDENDDDLSFSNKRTQNTKKKKERQEENIKRQLLLASVDGCVSEFTSSNKCQYLFRVRLVTKWLVWRVFLFSFVLLSQLVPFCLHKLSLRENISQSINCMIMHNGSNRNRTLFSCVFLCLMRWKTFIIILTAKSICCCVTLDFMRI